MIVSRRTFVAGRGCLDKALELLKAELKRVAPGYTMRFYSASIGPLDKFGYEVESESLAAHEKGRNEAVARMSPEFWAEWYKLTESGGTAEIWELR